MKRIIKLLTLSLLVLTLIFGGITAAAEDAASSEATSDVITELIAKCEKLPTVKTVSIEHKDLILEVKTAYDGLDVKQKAQLGAENLTKINEVYTAFEPALLADTAVRIKELPDKVKSKQKDEVTEIYKQYELLSDDAKESVSPELVEKLEKAVKKLAPELLGEEAATDTDTQSKSTSSGLILGMYIWEFIILCVLAVVTVFNLTLIALVAVKVFKK